MMPDDTFYFAYGSNLSIDRKQQRTGAIRSARLACLKDYRFAFNKGGASGEVYANIVPALGEVVWGVVYLCNPQAMTWLDEYEGVEGGHYRRITVEVHTNGGQIVRAETYIAGEGFIVKESRPSRSYLERILRGAEEHNLPAEHVRRIEELAGQITD